MIRRLLLLFWALWYTIVFASNLFDALVPTGLLPDSWAFSSGNADLVRQSTRTYSLPAFAPLALFTLVVLGELAVAILFWRAARAQWRRDSDSAADATVAFVGGLVFFGTMLLADEIFLVYRLADVTVVHWGVFTAQLVSLFVIRQPAIVEPVRRPPE